MSYTGRLKHLNDQDKEAILGEISSFLSEKGFIEGCSLLERMSSVLSYPLDDFTKRKINYIRENRKSHK